MISTTLQRRLRRRKIKGKTVLLPTFVPISLPLPLPMPIGHFGKCEHCGQDFLVEHTAQFECRWCLGWRKCILCGHDFILRVHNQKYCSQKCLKRRPSNVAAVRKWRVNNPAKAQASRRRSVAKNINLRLSIRLRSRLYDAFKGIRKSTHTMELLGCSIKELKQHLESQFQLGMTWDNYGKWHLDHIRPLASFDLAQPSQQRLACHWTNLQPLWAIDNLRKRSTWVV